MNFSTLYVSCRLNVRTVDKTLRDPIERKKSMLRVPKIKVHCVIVLNCWNHRSNKLEKNKKVPAKNGSPMLKHIPLEKNKF